MRVAFWKSQTEESYGSLTPTLSLNNLSSKRLSPEEQEGLLTRISASQQVADYESVYECEYHN